MNSKRKGILKVKGDNPDLEREFHISYLLSLSIEERYNLLFGMGEVSKELLKNASRQNKTIKRMGIPYHCRTTFINKET